MLQYCVEMTVIFYTTAQTWLSSLDAAGRAAVLTAFALPVMYSYFFNYYYRSSSCLNIHVFSRKHIITRVLLLYFWPSASCFRTIIPKVWVWFSLSSSFKQEKKKEDRKEAKAVRGSRYRCSFTAKKIIQESPENCAKRISFALLNL